jgi:hypothetical protein
MPVINLSILKPTFEAISVGGYKSLASPVSAELGLLSILAGANSAGKSSLIQPLLLLKQTIEAPYDPGALKLDGPNVEFSRAEEFLSRTPGQARGHTFELGIRTGMQGERTVFVFEQAGLNVRLVEVRYGKAGSGEVSVREGMSYEELLRRFAAQIQWADEDEDPAARGERSLSVLRERCFLRIRVSQGNVYWDFPLGSDRIGNSLRHLLHLPGLRGNLRRTYPAPEVKGPMPGKFSDYAASLVASWVESKDDRLNLLNEALAMLELTWKAHASRRDAGNVELFVARTVKPLREGAYDFVNVADAGFAVSQTLPVAVALVAAEPGQIVYIEQPEIHLHPRAQIGLAKVVVSSVVRGVQVILETHSELLLTSLRREIAEGSLTPELVRLHWFSRDAQGFTTLTSAQVDAAGAFGEWPVDFADVAMKEDEAYASAAFKRIPASTDSIR